MRSFEWSDIRFSLPAGWTVVCAENGLVAGAALDKSLTVTRRSGSIEELMATWDEGLRQHRVARVSETRVEEPLAGLLRVLVVATDRRARVLTQLFIDGREVVVATFGAPAGDSYDRDEADAIIGSIRVKQALPA